MNKIKKYERKIPADKTEIQSAGLHEQLYANKLDWLGRHKFLKTCNLQD